MRIWENLLKGSLLTIMSVFCSNTVYGREDTPAFFAFPILTVFVAYFIGKFDTTMKLYEAVKEVRNAKAEKVDSTNVDREVDRGEN